MSIPLEDNFTDIISKAQKGLNLADSVLAEQAGIATEAVQNLRAGTFDADAALAVAGPLHLNPTALVEIGEGRYEPASIGAFEGLAQFTTEFGEMTVNSYLAWDPATRDAAAFDTGSDCSGVLETLHAHGLRLRFIFLTHTHGDHVFDLDRLREKTGAPAYVSSKEAMDGAESIDAGREFWLGSLRVGGRLTWGHSKGGLTYVVSGLRRPVAIVGDAVFAGSMGGGSVSYQDALRTNLEEIYSLPDETIICPGHGPITSVREEKKHNPFYVIG